MQTELPELKYNADGLISCIVQDVETREVLMMPLHGLILN